MKFFMPVSVISFLAIAACVSKESCKTGDPGCQVEPVYGFCERNDGEFPVRPENNDAPTLPFLRVEGTRILDESGNPIALRGMNFGSWMMMETWIAGIGLKDEGQILDEMPVKAGDYGVNDLFMEAQQQNVIEWFAEDKSHWVLVQEWREYMQDNAP
ncbi:MAG: hypothetical protein FJ088_14760, partial [Deltaproteobacteria bacterium]|nr:hypothetical protein [Deltaproteobacteria bacterium]